MYNAQFERQIGGGITNPAESANEGMLTVGAAWHWMPESIEDFSGRGPAPDGRVKPDIVGADRVPTTFPGTFRGTSQAAPHVAGLAALVRQRYPELDPAGVAQYLKDNADPRPETPGGTATVPNNTWGYGLAHLPGPEAAAAPPPTPEPPGVGHAAGSGVTQLTATSITRLSSPSAGYNFSPAWSPDGRQIAFLHRLHWNDAIYVMNADGSGVTQLTPNSGKMNSFEWSPDGRRIVFAPQEDAEVYVVNTDSSCITQLTDKSKSGYSPAWSPDGRQTAFSAYHDDDGSNYLYAMNADGSGVTQLTDKFSMHSYPAWSPDGRQIAFASARGARDGYPKIFVMDVESVLAAAPVDDHPDTPSGATPIAPGQTLDGSIEASGDTDYFTFQATPNTSYTIETLLAFNPDTILALYDTSGSRITEDDDGGQGNASKIEWTAPARGSYYIQVRGYDDATGSYRLSVSSGVIQLTDNSAEDSLPVWSPDGRQIAFASDRDGDLEIYVMDVD